ncbi:MAG TPA: radical SAM protein [Candidatus Hydrogenedentes bacterium]|nr:radical SAM protein [Candidatus Hydrogenedentota bacterium]HPG67777.1 radical SAM protein [Candidatus Hydrogenedentota bacterium]
MGQLDLLVRGEEYCALPRGFTSRSPAHFAVERIVLASGSLATPEREAFVRRVCSAYPGVAVDEQLDCPHNRIDVGEASFPARHVAGKHTLVFGVLNKSVRFSDEAGNCCPNYWHYSVYGFCPYDCLYCYLAGTQGVWFSPTVKVYVNLREIVADMDRIAGRQGGETTFYHGKLQDGLALDPLTAYSTVLVPYFAQHPRARQILLTKSASVERLLPLEHNGRTTLSWSLNPAAIAERFERNVPSVAARVEAMKRCAAAGYPVRAVIMPLIPVAGWQELYTAFIADLVAEVPLERLTLGGLCSAKQATRLMERKLGKANAISCNMQTDNKNSDFRTRYAPDLCAAMYDAIIATARDVRPGLDIGLCLEDAGVWQAVHERWNLGRCNCIS